MKNFIAVFIYVLTFSVTAWAQNNKIIETPNLNDADKQLQNIISGLTNGKIDVQQTSETLQTLSSLQTTLNYARQYFVSEQESAQKKVNALGPAPEKTASEPANISKQRLGFTSQVEHLKADIAQTDLLFAKIDDINRLILKIRNRTLLNNILVKQSSVFHPQEFWQSLVSFSGFMFDLLKSPVSWYKNLSENRKISVKNNIYGVIFAMLAALISAFFVSRWIKKHLGYQKNIELPSYTQKLKATIWMSVARGVIPAFIIGSLLYWLKTNPFLNGTPFGILLETTAFYLLTYYVCKAGVRAVFTPNNDKWRIINIKHDHARAISKALIFSAAAICIVSFFQSLADKMEYDISIIYSIKIFANAVKASCIILTAHRALYDTPAPRPETADDEIQTAELSTASKISYAVSFSMFMAFLPSLFGYIRLSEYIINRFIISVAIAGCLYIIDNLIRTVFHRIMLLRFWVQTLRINRRTLVKTEFWFGLMLTPTIWILGVLILLAVWGVSVDLLLSRIKTFLIGFNIGGIHVSITSILLGFISFFILLSLFKMLKNSFVTGNLSKIEMSDGIRNSIVSSINFIGFIISGLIAVAIMGGSLNSITLIAGALSFGVGLGLQNMVSNLAAGLTILWERPLKIGDWVVINGQEGVVRRINMRSTELESSDKSTILIPNSDILSKSFTNYTYAGHLGRIVITIGTSLDADISQTKQTLLSAADNTPDVLASPQASAAFIKMNSVQMEFQLVCFTANVFNRSAVSNNLREKIVETFLRNDNSTGNLTSIA